jgi:hypothetical protein
VPSTRLELLGRDVELIPPRRDEFAVAKAEPDVPPVEAISPVPCFVGEVVRRIARRVDGVSDQATTHASDGREPFEETPRLVPVPTESEVPAHQQDRVPPVVRRVLDGIAASGVGDSAGPTDLHGTR